MAKFGLPRMAMLGGLLLASCAASPQVRQHAGRREASSGRAVLSLPVVQVATANGAGGPVYFHHPAKIRVRAPAGLYGRLAAYAAAGRIWLGPRGWRGKAAEGADGSTWVAIFPPRGNWKSGPRVIYRDDGNSAGCSVDDASQCFPAFAPAPAGCMAFAHRRRGIFGFCGGPSTAPILPVPAPPG